MKVTLIVAVADNGVIGSQGDLPWRLPAELAHFKRTTMGHHVIVGRKTYESIRRPLPGRTMVVVTRTAGYEAPGWRVAGTLEAALSLAEDAGDDEAFVAGGAEIYRLALPRADRIVLTRVHGEVAGDVTFPALDPEAWEEQREPTREADERNAFAFTVSTLERKPPS